MLEHLIAKKELTDLYPKWKQNVLLYSTLSHNVSGEFCIPNPVVNNINLQDAVEIWLQLMSDPIPNSEPFQLLL